MVGFCIAWADAAEVHRQKKRMPFYDVVYNSIDRMANSINIGTV
jgi:hypothetical protein